MADTTLGDRGDDQFLPNYWKHGKGALKIVWGTEGDFTRCVAAITEHVGPEQAKRNCARWHHDVTGKWPSEK